MSACGGMCFHQHLQTHKKTGASKAWVSRSKCEGGALSARARTEATKYIEHCVCVCVGGDSEDKEMEKQRRSRRNAHVHTCNSARSVRCAFAIASTWPGETPIKRMNEKHAPPLSSGGPPSVRSGGRDEWWTCSAVKMPRRERHNHGTYLGQELSVCVCVRVCVCVCVCVLLLWLLLLLLLLLCAQKVLLRLEYFLFSVKATDMQHKNRRACHSQTQNSPLDQRTRDQRRPCAAR